MFLLPLPTIVNFIFALRSFSVIKAMNNFEISIYMLTHLEFLNERMTDKLSMPGYE